MGSSRLPGKVLMPLGSSVVLDYVVSRCKQIKSETVIVATSTLTHDNPIEEWCIENKIPVFRGPEDDVLARYYEAALPYEPDFIIRVTGDCPFVDFDFGNTIVQSMLQSPADIVRVDESKLPRGLLIEMVSFKTLQYMYKYGHEERHREHVTYYAKEHSDKFKQTFVEVPNELQYPSLRITLDTEEDYELCKKIADHFEGDMLVPSSEVIKFLNANPDVAKINAHIEQKPVV